MLNIRQLAKRSSSLKSKKTPPGTPSLVKKAVRFADAFGLELINVKHVLDPDNPPEIPPEAISDLELGDGTGSEDADTDSNFLPAVAAAIGGDSQQQQQRLQTTLRPIFSQPGHSAGFNARVMAQKVVLESAAYAPLTGEICGYICVANLAFEKSVTVRVSFDSWRSSSEVGAEYVPHSSSGMTDRFSFSLALPGGPAAVTSAPPGRYRVAFCVAYRTCGQTFWDNNFGENYAFDSVVDAWTNRI
ncbi:hypothetical protein BOX15_Mlig001270g4 [Macrostomum lignano]|uniref:CBM21 domain-containing protein n=1 Tax=Macrostomum lignano TaxID=282301 RepID=A0A267GAV7_9PLAT|nr:hypothetical protein BOX15_Mlig001270g4 [Macrostomum lignano]